MCGRFSVATTEKKVKKALPDVEVSALKLSYNIAPSHQVAVLAAGQPLQLQPMRWGLIPHWSPDGIPMGSTINARAEGIEDKPVYRDPVRQRRCVIPADSFYEWKKSGTLRWPYRILRADEDILLFAGIWDEWQAPIGQSDIRSFSIITTTPNIEMQSVHDRMPVILPDFDAATRWLDDDTPLDEAMAMLRPAPDHSLRMYRVSERLNQVRVADDARLHEQVPEQKTLFDF